MGSRDTAADFVPSAREAPRPKLKFMAQANLAETLRQHPRLRVQ
jgi:hypothetical protein